MEGMEVLENRKKGYTMLPSRCDIASVFMNSQQLWFLASSVHKTDPVKCHPGIGKRLLGLYPLLQNYWLMRDYGRGNYYF